jgi:hypothetical protein
MYKSEFGLEKYFTILLPADFMYNMCKFRCGSHKLPIEMGRFFSIDRSDRICDLCNKEELGDEFHYLFNCTFVYLVVFFLLAIVFFFDLRFLITSSVPSNFSYMFSLRFSETSLFFLHVS